VQTLLAIGDFSRASHLSIKMLRYYHEVGLLEPAEVDAESGYRRYATEQIATAQIIRRFRELDMPLEEIQAVLEAPDVATRNQLIAAHLVRLESSLARVQGAVAALRSLLERPNTSAAIAHQRVPATTAAAISQVIGIGDAVVWLQGALGELNATLAAQHIARVGAPGGMYSTELFTDENGLATVFVACSPVPRPMGRVKTLEIPAVDLATIVHSGPYAGMETAYGALATHVAQHALAIPGPVREYYLVGPADTPDETTWRTEVGWPIFQMAGP